MYVRYAVMSMMRKKKAGHFQLCVLPFVQAADIKFSCRK